MQLPITGHTDLWLIRHTETDWNRERRYQSRSDRSLTIFGQRRAEAVVRRLHRVRLEIVVSTGLSRTDALAAQIAAGHTGAQHLTDQRWREADHGGWEGLTYAEVQARYPGQAAARFADTWTSTAHGGESASQLWERTSAALHDLLRQHDRRHIAIVGHGGPLQLVICALLGLDLSRSWQMRLDPGGITNLDLYPTGTILRHHNDIPPLTS